MAQEPTELPDVLVELYERYHDQSVPASSDAIFETLTLLIDTYSEVYFIVDALDECSDELRWDLLEKLRACTPKARLMITSRFLDNINEELNDFARLEIKAHKADLELFVDRHIQKNKNLRRIVEKSAVMRSDITEAIIATAEDMHVITCLK